MGGGEEEGGGIERTVEFLALGEVGGEGGGGSGGEGGGGLGSVVIGEKGGGGGEEVFDPGGDVLLPFGIFVIVTVFRGVC